MNNQEIKYLSKECKETLLNFFITRGFASKKSFEKLLITKHKYENRLWEPNVTIVNHILSEKDFSISKASLNNLYKLTQEWSIPDQNGENSLFFLIKKNYKIKEIIQLSQEFNIQYTQKNHEGLYFINNFLCEKNINHIVQQAYAGINSFPEIRISRYLKEYLEIIQLFPELFKDTIQIEKTKFENIKKILMEEEFQKFNKNQIGISLNKEIEKVEKTLLYLALENQFKNRAIKTKKSKI